MGTLLAVVIVFLILYLVSQSAGYYRRRLSVAGTETGGTDDVRSSALTGAAAGALALVLLFLLYLGITRWEWLGHPTVSIAPAPSVAPLSSPVNQGVGAPSPSTASPAASPSK
jgi:hypothetical protein